MPKHHKVADMEFWLVDGFLRYSGPGCLWERAYRWLLPPSQEERYRNILGEGPGPRLTVGSERTEYEVRWDPGHFDATVSVSPIGLLTERV